MARLAGSLKKDNRTVHIKTVDPNKSKGKTWDNMPTLKQLLKKKNIFI